MILAVDAGNTRVKVSVAGATTVRALLAVPTALLTEDPGGLADALETCPGLPRRLDGAVFCSVVPGSNRSLSAVLRRVAGATPVAVSHDSVFPFRLRVRRPAKVGSDRLAAAAGAIGPGRQSAIVVDAGTAITVDLVVRREFRGGLIMAGPGLMLEALGTHARRLPRLDPHALARPDGRFDDTESAMLLGARAAAAGAVIEGVRTLRRAAGFSPRVLLTGGGMGIIGDRLPPRWRRDPDLVARGLYRLWTLNEGRGKKNP